MMTYGELEQAMEDDNFAACRAAYKKSYPYHLLSNHEGCEDGEWECVDCPWKTTMQTETKEQ